MVTKSNSVKASNIVGFVSKTQYNSDKQNFGKKIEDVNRKIPNTIGLVKKTDNTKIIKNEKKKKPLDSTNQGSKAALNVDAADIKNKVTAASHFINTSKFNKLMKTSLNATMKQAEKILASKLKSIIH